ncbi:MAG: hypothetical protein K0A99_01555, partial [Desulfoarculaceae bacterium]|nr:hypothetical protein [Desulfoarculaceae bacterium]
KAFALYRRLVRESRGFLWVRGEMREQGGGILWIASLALAKTDEPPASLLQLTWVRGEMREQGGGILWIASLALAKTDEPPASPLRLTWVRGEMREQGGGILWIASLALAKTDGVWLLRPAGLLLVPVRRMGNEKNSSTTPDPSLSRRGKKLHLVPLSGRVQVVADGGVLAIQLFVLFPFPYLTLNAPYVGHVPPIAIALLE